MTTVAFLGLGAMGSRMVKHIVESDYSLKVWNRSKTTYQELEGINSVDSIESAVTEADVVVSMVRDDQASKALWLDQEQGALKFMKPEAVAIECSTLSPQWTRELAAACHLAGCDLVDAPVVGSRPQAEAKQLIFVAGGEPDTVKAVTPILLSMGQALHYSGSVGSGSTIKLAINAMLGVQVSMMAELLGFMQRQNLDSNSALDIIASTPVCSPVAKVLASSMLSNNFSPLFPIELMHKDLGYIQQLAQLDAATLPMTSSAQKIFQEAIRQGLEKNNMTGIVKLFLT